MTPKDTFNEKSTAVKSAVAADVSFDFATAEQGRQILTQRDDYVQRLGPFDRAARMRTDQDVSEETYLKFVATQVLDWTDQEKRRLDAMLEKLRPEMAKLGINWPQSIAIVKTTGNEEAGDAQHFAAYTRANAIMLPVPMLRSGPMSPSFEHILAHELFHILSTHNPGLRDKLYSIIGFERCREPVLPPGLAAIKITNPDAPRNNHYIKLEYEGKPISAIPVLVSAAEKYKGGSFFDYFQFKLLQVNRDEKTRAVSVAYEGGKPRLLEPTEVSGFFEQIGKNTSYIIHPEEIMADNFALLLRGQARFASPEIPKKMREVFAAEKARLSPPVQPGPAQQKRALKV